MKAALFDFYGDIDQLYIDQVDIPEPNHNEVQIQVKASSINSSDYYSLQGKPFMIRFFSGLFKPKYHILGGDISGIITKTGKDVTQFKIGDFVACDQSDAKRGGYAEYAVSSETLLAKLPKNVSFQDAAAIPLAGVTALQGLQKGHIKSGQKILVSGASGGVGSLAVLIAKALGAEVTALSSSSKLEKVKLLEAHHTIDSSKEDITLLEQTYDLIFDAASYRPFTDYDKILKPKGSYILAGGSMKNIAKISLFGKRLSKKNGKHYCNYLAKAKAQDLTTLLDFLSQGHLTPLIDKTFSLDQIREAFAYYQDKKTTGKIVIII